MNLESPQPDSAADKSFDPRSIHRPHPLLLKYYLLTSLLSGPAFPIVALVMYFKYETMHYEFRDDGVSMSWGILFRREVHLTYRRLQDIHLTRNLLQRWFGLATVSLQTASGSAMPEMSIEGILAAEALRDYLYAKMRGGSAAAAESGPAPTAAATAAGHVEGASDDEVLVLLRDIRDRLQVLADRSGGHP